MIEKNKIHFGDCLQLMPEIDDGSIDMILCDLPYGTTRNKWDCQIDLIKLWHQYKRVIKLNGAICLFAQTPFDKILGVSNMDMLRYEWIWHKTQATGTLNANKMPMKAHENILVFYKKLPTYNPQKTTGHERKVSTSRHRRNSKQSTNYNSYDSITYDSTERFPRSVLIFKNDKQKMALHPTQKPVLLMEYFISTYCNEGDLILDNCIGSGTTAIASMNRKMNYIGMENDPEIFGIAIKRESEHKSLIYSKLKP